MRFWAPWCTTCRKDPNGFDKKAKLFESSKAKFIKCNVNKDKEFLEGFGITALPKVFVFKDGERIPDLELTGAGSKYLRGLVEKVELL